MHRVYRFFTWVLISLMIINPIIVSAGETAPAATTSTTQSSPSAVDTFGTMVGKGMQTFVETYKTYKESQKKEDANKVTEADKAAKEKSEQSVQQGQELANQGQAGIDSDKAAKEAQNNKTLGDAKSKDLPGAFGDAADSQTGLDKLGQMLAKIGGIMKTVGSILTAIGTVLQAIPYTAAIGAAMVKIGGILTKVGTIVEMLGNNDIAGAAKSAQNDFNFANDSSKSASTNEVKDSSTVDSTGAFQKDSGSEAGTTSGTGGDTSGDQRGSDEVPTGGE